MLASVQEQYKFEQYKFAFTNPSCLRKKTIYKKPEEKNNATWFVLQGNARRDDGGCGVIAWLEFYLY